MRFLIFVILLLFAVSIVSSGQEIFFSASNDRPNSKIIYTSIETEGPLTKLKGYFIPKTMVISPFNPDEYIVAGKDTLKSISKLTWLDKDTSAVIKSFYYFNTDTVHFIKYFQPLLHPTSDLYLSDDTLTIHFSNHLIPGDKHINYTPVIDSILQSQNMVGAYRILKSVKSIDDNYTISEDWVKWIFPQEYTIDNMLTEYINVGFGVNKQLREKRLQHGKIVIKMATEDITKNKSYAESLENLMFLGDSILYCRGVNDIDEYYGILIEKAVEQYKKLDWESVYDSPLLDIFINHYIKTGNVKQLIEFADIKNPYKSYNIYSGIFGKCAILDYFLETKNYQIIIDLTQRYINDMVDWKEEDITQNKDYYKIAYYYVVSLNLLGHFAEAEKITEVLLDKLEKNLYQQTLYDIFDKTHIVSNLMYVNADANFNMKDLNKSEKMLRKIEYLWAKDYFDMPLEVQCRLSRFYQVLGVDSAAYRLAVNVAEDCNKWICHQLSDTLTAGILRNDNNIFLLRHNNFEEYINLPLEIGMKLQDPVLLRLVYNNNCVNKKLISDIENNFLKYFFINDSLQKEEGKNINRILNRINVLDKAGIRSTSEIVSLQSELRQAKGRMFRSFIRENPKPIIIPDYFNETIANLKHNSIAVEFLPIKEYDKTGYIALILQQNDSLPHIIRLCREDDLQSLSCDDNCYLEKIYDLIWDPMKSYIESRDTLYFSTSGLLNQLPIENALFTRSNINLFRLSCTHNLIAKEYSVKGSMSYVIYGDLDYDNANDEFMQINYPYIPSSFRSVRNLRGKKGRLKWTRAEIDSISFAISKTHNICHVLDKLKGTESSVYSLNRDSVNILHFSTHGFFFNAEDLDAEEKKNLPFMLFDFDAKPSYVENKSMTRSGLLLCGANKTLSGSISEDYDPMSDGILTAQEISTMTFPNLNHVVLSACETGLGENCSEGVYGLQRGLKNAGAKSILMSLWEVDDFATSIFMTQYYKNLLANMSKEKSLRVAQSYLQNYSEKYCHPYYWAGWILLDALD